MKKSILKLFKFNSFFSDEFWLLSKHLFSFLLLKMDNQFPQQKKKKNYPDKKMIFYM